MDHTEINYYQGKYNHYKTKTKEQLVMKALKRDYMLAVEELENEKLRKQVRRLQNRLGFYE
jgi:hypothetical protein